MRTTSSTNKKNKNNEILYRPTLSQTPTTVNTTNKNQYSLIMNNTNKLSTYFIPTSTIIQRTLPYFPNNNQNNINDKDTYETNNKNTENKYRSELPKSKKLLFGNTKKIYLN